VKQYAESPFIYVYRLAMLKTGANIASNTMLAKSACILCKTAGINKSMHRATKSNIARNTMMTITEMSDMMMTAMTMTEAMVTVETTIKIVGTVATTIITNSA
jgi:hypothetical protein